MACPGLGGGHNWQATAYNPKLGLYYFSSTDGCQVYFKSKYQFIEGEWYQLSNTDPVEGEPQVGSLVAMDPNTGNTRWRHEMVRTPSGGVLTTGGGLVFTGDAFGNLIAFDGQYGERTVALSDRRADSRSAHYLHVERETDTRGGLRRNDDYVRIAAVEKSCGVKRYALPQSARIRRTATGWRP